MKIKYDEKDFFLLAQRLSDSKNISVTKWWNIFYEVILRQLYISGAVYLPNIGWLELKKKEGKVYTRKKSDGSVEIVDIPARNVPCFKPEDDFINDVNLVGITKNYRQRVKNGALTARDKLREQRTQEMLGDNLYFSDKAKEKYTEILKEGFEERLKNMRKNYEKEMEASLENVTGTTSE